MLDNWKMSLVQINDKDNIDSDIGNFKYCTWILFGNRRNKNISKFIRSLIILPWIDCATFHEVQIVMVESNAGCYLPFIWAKYVIIGVPICDYIFIIVVVVIIIGAQHDVPITGKLKQQWRNRIIKVQTNLFFLRSELLQNIYIEREWGHMA